jgi:hypothetical protein
MPSLAREKAKLLAMFLQKGPTHWGRADYSDGRCRWCRRALPDNDTSCKCPGWKANEI